MERLESRTALEGMASNEDVVYVGMEASTQNQQGLRRTSANHQRLTGRVVTPPPAIPESLSQLITSPSTQTQQRGTSVNHQGLTGISTTPPHVIPLLNSLSPQATMGGGAPLLLMPGSPTPVGTPHAQQIQALNLLLHAQQLQAIGGSSPSVPKVRVVPGVRGGVGKRVVLEREIKPSEEQEEINKMAKEEVHQTTR